jgi:hypothetical protein
MKYRKKLVVVEATQWFENGDHPEVRPNESVTFTDDGQGGRKIVARPVCARCGQDLNAHGWVGPFEWPNLACPGDWIITGVQGEHYPCKPDIFEATYEAVDAG